NAARSRLSVAWVTWKPSASSSAPSSSWVPTGDAERSLRMASRRRSRACIVPLRHRGFPSPQEVGDGTEEVDEGDQHPEEPIAALVAIVREDVREGSDQHPELEEDRRN